MTVQQQKAAAAAVSVASNTGLVLLKLTAGLLMGSVSVISEAIHSGIDLIAALIAFFSIRASGKPRDKEHPFGHEKFENLSGAVEAILIFLAAIWIIIESVRKLLHPTEIEGLGWGVAIMLFSATANFLVSQMLFRVGKKTDSMALIADAWHLRTDVYTSAGVMIGLAIITAGHYLLPAINLTWIDPLVAIGVAVLIGHAAYELTRASVKDLVDVSLPEAEEEWICDTVAGYGPVVRGMHSLRTRKAGPARFIDFHVYVDRSMSVDESHALNHRIADAIRAQFEHANVTIHIEPCTCDKKGECLRESIIEE
jgi:cation diffusion facilitator family transporter